MNIQRGGPFQSFKTLKEAIFRPHNPSKVRQLLRATLKFVDKPNFSIATSEDPEFSLWQQFFDGDTPRPIYDINVLLELFSKKIAELIEEHGPEVLDKIVDHNDDPDVKQLSLQTRENIWILTFSSSGNISHINIPRED